MANEAVVGILRALLTTNAAEFTRQIGQSSKALDQFSRNARRMGRQATEVGQAFTRAFTVPITAGFAGVVKVAVDFENSFTGVAKTVDATETQLAQLAEGFRALSREIPINVNEINRVGEAAGQLGIQTENILDFTRTMSMLGVTTNLSAQDAATQMARLANITQMSQRDFGKLGSVLVDLGNNFATTEREILDMSLRLAGAGQQIGLTEGEILGLATAMSSLGIRSESGGSAMSRVMIEIAKAVDLGGQSLTTFAQVAMPESTNAVADFSEKFRTDAAGALDLFVKGMGKVEAAGHNIFQVLEDLEFGNVRVRDTVLRLAGAGDQLTNAFELQNKAWRENSALQDEAQRRFSTTASRALVLWNRIKDVGITIGNALLPMINAAIAAMDRMIPIIETMANLFKGLPVPIQVVAVGLAGMAAGIPLLITLFGQLAFAASSLAAAFTSAGFGTLGMAGFLTQLGRVRTGLSALFPTFAAAGGAIAAFGLRAAGGIKAVGLAAAPAVLALKPLAIGAAAVAAAFASWKFLEWVGGLTNLSNWFERLSARIRGMDVESVRLMQKQREMLEQFEEAREGVEELAESFRSIALQDMAQFKNASDAVKQAAAEMAGILPSAWGEVNKLADAAMRVSQEGKLTPGVLHAIATAALQLEAQTGDLPPVLRNIVNAFQQMEIAAEDLTGTPGPSGGGLGGADDAVDEFAESVKELVNRIQTDGIPATNVWMAALEQVGGVTALTTDKQQELAGVIDQAIETWEAMGERAPLAVMAIRTAVNDLEGDLRFMIGTLEKAQTLPILSEGINLSGRFQLPRAQQFSQELKDMLHGTGGIVRTIEDDIVALSGRLPNLIIRAIQGGGDVFKTLGTAFGLQFGESFGTQIAELFGGGRVAQAIGGALGSLGALAGDAILSGGAHSTGSLVASGAMMGASIGNAIVPGIGAAVGASIGGLVGLLRGMGRSTAENIGIAVGRQWGLSISEELTNTIAEQAEASGGNAIGAMMSNLSKIIEENGGVLAVGLERTIALTRDLFSMIQTGALTSEQAGQELNTMFGLLIPHAIDTATGEIREDFLELIDLMHTFGLSSEELNTALGDVFDELEDVTDKRLKLIGQIAHDGAKAIAALIAAGFGAQTGFDGILTNDDDEIVLFREGELDVAQRAIVAFFTEMMESGKTFEEAIKAFGPAIKDLAARMEEAGFTGSESFRQLAGAAKAFDDEGLKSLIERGQLAGDTLAALSALGMVTAADFSVLGAAIQGSFQELINNGVPAEQALLILRPQLALLIRLQEEFGFAVDANTQELIDMAKQAGISGDEGKTAAEKQLEAFDRLIEALNQLVEQLQGPVTEAVEDVGKLDPTVKFSVDISEVDKAKSKLRQMKINVPVKLDPQSSGGSQTPSSGPGSSGIGPTGGPTSFFGGGTPRLDFASFGGETIAALHGDEAVIPRGGGHDLAMEIADALTGLPDGGVNVTVQSGAVRVEGVDEQTGQRILMGLAEAIHRGGRPVSRFVGAVKEAAA